MFGEAVNRFPAGMRQRRIPAETRSEVRLIEAGRYGLRFEVGNRDVDDHVVVDHLRIGARHVEGRQRNFGYRIDLTGLVGDLRIGLEQLQDIDIGDVVGVSGMAAIDLMENEKSVGGLNRVCTVLNELVDVINLDSLDDSFFKISPTPVFQRLGYIFDHILEREDLAEILYSKIAVAGLKLRKVPFKINKPTEGCEIEKRWKVIINQKIEIDE